MGRVRAWVDGLGDFVDTLLPPVMLSGAKAVREAKWSPDEPGVYCRRCGATAAWASQTLEGCPVCRGRRLAWDQVWRLSAYQMPVSRWVLDMKFRRAFVWAPWFGEALGERLRGGGKGEGGECGEGSGSGLHVIVPVPLHWWRRWRRGYDQALLISRGISRRTGWPIAPVIRRRRATAAQSEIHDHTRRLKNVRQAFAIRRVDLTGYTAWVVDDVKTSGATATACARLLKRAGAVRVNLVVVAVADPHRTRNAERGINRQDAKAEGKGKFTTEITEITRKNAQKRHKP